MHLRDGRRLLSSLALLLFILAACSQPDQSQPVPVPKDAPTATAPTSSPAGTGEEIKEFARQWQVVDDEWLQIRDDFDRWSAQLTACEPSSMHEALDEFAAGFRGITEQARGFTHTRATGDLSDMLITAAEEEETAFRQLRDRWVPNNFVLFERVEEQRAQASRARREAEDRVIALREVLEEAPDPDKIAEFSRSLGLIRNDWLNLHGEYTVLRDGAEKRKTFDTLSGFDRIAKGMASMVASLGELPRLTGADETVDDLIEAAEDELKAFEAAGEQLKDVESGPSADSMDPGVVVSGPEPLDFTTVDRSVAISEAALKRAVRTVGSINDADVAETLADLQIFSDEHARLRLAWDAFHGRYNNWRKSAGGCEQIEVIRTLERFNLRAGNVSRKVRDLPRSGRLLPVHSLLADAVKMEEDAIRMLSYTWQPFTTDAFRAVHQARVDADFLQREADISVQELIDRALQ